MIIELTILAVMTVAALSFIAFCVIITLMAMGVGTEMKEIKIDAVRTEDVSIDLVDAFKRGALVNQPWLK